MSAFLLPPYHISVLAVFAVTRKPAIVYHNGVGIELGFASAVALDLWKQNLRSVNWRYNCTDRPSFRFDNRALRGGLTMVEIIKAAHSYQYQSCETDDWEECYARGLYLHIMAEAQTRLPGYEEAEWVLDPPKGPA